MIKYLFKGALSAIVIKLIDNYRRLTIQLLKIEAAKSYVHGVKLARFSAIGLMRMGLVIALICLGGVLLHVGLFILLPWGIKAKALLGMLLGVVYVTIGGVALRTVMDEKTWMEKSGAAEMLKEAMGQSKED